MAGGIAFPRPATAREILPEPTISTGIAGGGVPGPLATRSSHPDRSPSPISSERRRSMSGTATAAAAPNKILWNIK